MQFFEFHEQLGVCKLVRTNAKLPADVHNIIMIMMHGGQNIKIKKSKNCFALPLIINREFFLQNLYCLFVYYMLLLIVYTLDITVFTFENFPVCIVTLNHCMHMINKCSFHSSSINCPV